MKVSVLCVVLLACFAMAPSQASARKLQQTITDVDILNLALNLEYLEVSNIAACLRCCACSMAGMRLEPYYREVPSAGAWHGAAESGCVVQAPLLFDAMTYSILD
jgi:hypothetical protein